MIWQNKRLLKTQKVWQKPSWVGNKPKGLTNEEWTEQVRDWKLDKLIILGKAPKIKVKLKQERDDE